MRLLLIVAGLVLFAAAADAQVGQIGPPTLFVTPSGAAPANCSENLTVTANSGDNLTVTANSGGVFTCH